MSESQATNLVKDGPVGLGGWLVLPMLGLFLCPVFGVAQFSVYKDILASWPFLNVYQSLFIAVELLGNVILIFVAPVVLLVFMFKRLEMFPGWYMIWAMASPVFLIADALLVPFVFPDAFSEPGSTVFDKETVRGISRSIWAAVIWIPYMMRSERVANTFVN